ncbi:hypothetical protein VCUG_01344 [Vavraia culicis subsp. floridensis]|uniref:Deacetylase sirtuin-type domain-containing protein n=1 Tax=Vavraia culicis (isolate floridensis) TaxID=948595 RepID=L2GVL9_VAVCU|nr:uncharacterized protein VCUG_01344 [Vavraia culicis subsp. floridensis]ELA47155.1 hypothetical protein VCUG_01344 [Vavraia culicis subsp. floridensis]
MEGVEWICSRLTTNVPTAPWTAFPSTLHILRHPSSPSKFQMKKIDASYVQANKSIFTNKNTVIVVGAGLSVPSNIPDFRSTDGLFATLKKRYKIRGEHIFTYRFTIDKETRSTYLKVISELKQAVDAAQPSHGHYFLSHVREFEKKVRVYTQNVDGLEERAGLKCTKDFGTELVYLHGNLNVLVCTYCGYSKQFGREEREAFGRGCEVECERCLTKNYGQGAKVCGGMDAVENEGIGGGDKRMSEGFKDKEVMTDRDGTVEEEECVGKKTVSRHATGNEHASAQIGKNDKNTGRKGLRDELTNESTDKSRSMITGAQPGDKTKTRTNDRCESKESKTKPQRAVQNRKENAKEQKSLKHKDVHASKVEGSYKAISETPKNTLAPRTSRKLVTGMMNTNIIHYYQVHPDSHYIATMTKKDSNCQLLIVMGTSLKVHGVKQLVKYFSRVVRANNGKSVFVNLESVCKNMMECFDMFYEGTIDEFCGVLEECAGHKDERKLSMRNFVCVRSGGQVGKGKDDNKCGLREIREKLSKNKPAAREHPSKSVQNGSEKELLSGRSDAQAIGSDEHHSLNTCAGKDTRSGQQRMRRLSAIDNAEEGACAKSITKKDSFSAVESDACTNVSNKIEAKERQQHNTGDLRDAGAVGANENKTGEGIENVKGTRNDEVTAKDVNTDEVIAKDVNTDEVTVKDVNTDEVTAKDSLLKNAKSTKNAQKSGKNSTATKKNEKAAKNTGKKDKNVQTKKASNFKECGASTGTIKEVKAINKGSENQQQDQKRTIKKMSLIRIKTKKTAITPPEQSNGTCTSGVYDEQPFDSIRVSEGAGDSVGKSTCLTPRKKMNKSKKMALKTADLDLGSSPVVKKKQKKK